MTIDRLRTILEAYGADPSRWPGADRADAVALLERSAEARSLRDEAARLDAMLDAAPAAAPSEALAGRVLDGVPASTQRRGRRWTAMLAPVAAAALVVLWLTRAPTTTPTGAPTLPLASIGVYETPTDTLLSLPGLDVLDTVPALSCPESGLGCLDDDMYDRATTERVGRTLA